MFQSFEKNSRAQAEILKVSQLFTLSISMKGFCSLIVFIAGSDELALFIKSNVLVSLPHSRPVIIFHNFHMDLPNSQASHAVAILFAPLGYKLSIVSPQNMSQIIFYNDS